MGCEIEIKARVENIEQIFEKLEKLSYSTYHGKVEKKDIYWSKSLEDSLLFRTRFQEIDGKKSVLITSKPSKNKAEGTEINVENEFEADSSQWENIIHFCEGLNLVHYRHKYKKGWQFTLKKNGFEIHAELFDVKYLGNFLEMEICGENIESFDVDSASESLRLVLDDLEISRNAIEPRGYSKLLEDVCHILD